MPLADVLRDRGEYFSPPEENWTPTFMGTPGRSAQEDAYEMQRVAASQAVGESFFQPDDFAPGKGLLKALKLGGTGMLAAGALVPTNPAAHTVVKEIRGAFAPVATRAIEKTSSRKLQKKGWGGIDPEIESVSDIPVTVAPNMSTYIRQRAAAQGEKPALSELIDAALSMPKGAYRPATRGEQLKGMQPEIFIQEKGFEKSGSSVHEGAHVLFPLLREQTAQRLRAHYLKRDPSRVALEIEMSGGDPFDAKDWLNAIRADPDLVTGRGQLALNELFAREMQGILSPGPAARHLLSPVGRALGAERFPKPEQFDPQTLEELTAYLDDVFSRM